MTDHLTVGGPIIYTTCVKGYDSLSHLHGELYQARRSYFDTGKKVKNNKNEIVDGVSVQYQYSLSYGKLKWLKKTDVSILETAEYYQDGFCIFLWGVRGNLISKSNYSKGHEWLRTSYYGSAATKESKPELILSPAHDCNGLNVLRHNPALIKYDAEKLLACSVSLGTSTNSLVNSELGEPDIYCSISSGDFCYCTEEILKKRNEIVRRIQEGNISAQPVWMPEEETPPAQTKQQPEALEQPKEELPSQTTLSNNKREEKALSIEESVIRGPISCDLQNVGLAGTSYAANHEIFHVEVEPGPPPVVPTKYRVAAKSIDGTVVRSAKLRSKEETPDFNDEKTIKHQSETEPDTLKPAKSIVISAQESYLYFGTVIDDLRQGRGRTQMPDGMTAYEGEYKEDQRNGFGVYYYRTGKINYAGNWKENQRDGAGVSFRSEDGAMSVGCWENDHPVGTSSVFDSNGNLKFAGRIENGARQGVGISYSATSGTAFVGKWRNNVPTGEGSEFDCNGNLLYTGGWKDGKRNGFGTEYSPQGAILFVGVWKENKRWSGTVYHHGIPGKYSRDSANEKV